MHLMSFSLKLRGLREERQMSQSELGKAIGVNKSYVSAWETGKGKPSFDNLLALSKFFGISLDYLAFDNVPREGVEAINDFELYQYFRKAESLPTEVQQAIKEILDSIVFKHKVNQIPEAKPFSKKPEQQQPLRKVAGKR